ncbi:MAG TPA: hypothetical protein VF522_20660 [Ramlibacter sp.]|uniref:hypothetical protein n=1 Tax=Ramlibacter sp. TaxID=1917967 RepID=UPI002ED34184
MAVIVLAAVLAAGCERLSTEQGGMPPERACSGGGPCVGTIAGTGEFGNTDGPIATARFFFPHSVAIAPDASIHVADYGNHNRTRAIAAGRVTTPVKDAVSFPFPPDRATDNAGNTYVADRYENRILKIAPDGTQSVLAGTGLPGSNDGDAASATFSFPTGVAFDGKDTLYVADMGNRRIRRIRLKRAVPSGSAFADEPRRAPSAVSCDGHTKERPCRKRLPIPIR